MLKRLHVLLAALGLTTIALMWSVEPFVGSRHDDLYHWSGTATKFYSPVLLLFLSTWCLSVFVLQIAKQNVRLCNLLSGLLLVVAPLLVGKDISASIPLLSSPAVVGSVLCSSCACIYLVLSARKLVSDAFFATVIRRLSTLLAFVGLSGTLLLCQLSILWYQARTINLADSLHVATTLTQPSLQRPRIIWIILDELSYEQVYGKRYPSLKLAAFDQLASEATVFTNVIPAGRATEQVIPALFTGEPIDQVRSGSDGALWVNKAGAVGWQTFNPNDTLFHDALALGYRTAVVGWYNPYCRILSTFVDACTWEYRTGAANGMQPDASVWQNAMGILAVQTHGGIATRLLGAFRGLDEQALPNREMHIRDFQTLFTKGDAALLDRTNTFTYLHLPVPHPGGIYDRRTGELSSRSSSYIDNLALADRYLAHVRNLLTQTGQWDTCAVVVMGDHSWRTQQLWRKLGGWTTEDEQASGQGTFDARPAYIVKLPGQKTSVRIDLPFRATDTRRILQTIMRRQVMTTSDLQEWVSGIALPHLNRSGLR